MIQENMLELQRIAGKTGTCNQKASVCHANGHPDRPQNDQGMLYIAIQTHYIMFEQYKSSQKKLTPFIFKLAA